MNPSIAISFCFLLMVGCSNQPIQKVNYISNSESVNKILASSGTQSALLEFEAAMKGIALQDQSLDSDKKEVMVNIIKDSFSSSIMIEDVHDYYRENITDLEIQQALIWLDSPLGRKFVAWEVDSISRADGLHSKKLSQYRKDAKRVKILSRLHDAMMLESFTSELMPALFRGIFGGINKIQNLDDRVSQAELNNYINTLSKAAIENIDKELIDDSLLTYEGATDKELKEYLEFLKTPSGKKYTEVLIGSFLYSFNYASDRFGKAISHEVGEVNTKALFDLSACLIKKTKTMCLIEKEGRDDLISPAVNLSYVNAGSFRLKAPSSNWRKIIRSNDELSLIHNRESAAIFVTMDRSFKGLKSGETFDDLAKEQLKGLTDKLGSPAEKVSLEIWPYVNNGAVYGICFNTLNSTQECVYSAVASMPDGLVTMQGLTELKDIEMQELVQWMASIDVLNTNQN